MDRNDFLQELKTLSERAFVHYGIGNHGRAFECAEAIYYLFKVDYELTGGIVKHDFVSGKYDTACQRCGRTEGHEIHEKQ